MKRKYNILSMSAGKIRLTELVTEGEGARITESRGEKDWENPAEKRYGEEKCEGYKSDRVRQREVGVVFHGWLNLCLSLPEAFKLATSSIHWHHGVTLSSSPLHMFYTHSYCNCGCTSWMHPGAQYTGVPLEHVLLGQPTQVGPKGVQVYFCLRSFIIWRPLPFCSHLSPLRT